MLVTSREVVSKLKRARTSILPRKDIMKIRHADISLCMASSLLFSAGCSLMIDQPKGDPQSPSALERQSKNLAGVYGEIGSNGSIKPHPSVVGTAGHINGLIIVGGMLDVLDIKTGAIKRQGATGEPTPKVRIGNTTFSSGSGSTGTSSSTGTSGPAGQ